MKNLEVADILYEEALSSVSRKSSALSRLTEEMLMLARLDAGGSGEALGLRVNRRPARPGC